MPVKMEIPDSLRYLVAEDSRATVVIGTQAYAVVPLTSAQVKKIAGPFCDMLTAVAEEILKTIGIAKVSEEFTPEQASTFLLAIRGGLNRVAVEGKLDAIVAILTDLTEEEVSANVTIKQLHHIVSVVWKQNFDFSDAPEETEKNFQSLLNDVGFGNPIDRTVLQWADSSLAILIDPRLGSENERVTLVLQAAYELDLVTLPPNELRREHLKNIQLTESTETTHTTTDSPEST